MLLAQVKPKTLESERAGRRFTWLDSRRGSQEYGRGGAVSTGPRTGFEIDVPGRQDESHVDRNPVFRSANLCMPPLPQLFPSPHLLGVAISRRP